MKTKEEVIKEAWGLNYDKFKSEIDSYGWLPLGYEFHLIEDVGEVEKLGHGDDTNYNNPYSHFRPISLQGIEEYYSFVDIKGFENYQVNRLGIIMSKSRVSTQKNGKSYRVKEKVMKPQIDNTGYIVFGLRNTIKNKKIYLHRVLAECFIPNPNNLPCVNHKDGVKYNNSISNLEWCTYKENNNHAFNNGLNNTIGHRLKGKKGEDCHNYGKSKKVYCGNKIYNSVKEASVELGVSVGYLYKCLCGAVNNKYNLSYQPIIKPKPPLY